jgi:phage terminase large subunit-like protein
VAAWVAFTKQNARIRFVGNDLKQADSRVFNALTTAIELNPKWRAEVTVKLHTATFPTGSIIESVPVDPAGEAGGNDDMIEWTELWAAKSNAHQKLWSELTLSPTKFGQSFRWVDTYAGYSGESRILESLYEQGVKQGEQIDLGIPGLEAYRNTAARLFVLWNTVPRLTWLTPEYYAQEASTLTESEFERMHRNQWVTSEQTFVPLEWWNACQVKSMPAMERGAPMVVALDAGISSDTFGMVGVGRNGKNVQVRYVHKWTPPKGGKLDFKVVEDELRRLFTLYNIAEVAYDPYQLHDFCKRLQREGLGFFREFNQGADRLVSDRQLYDMIRDRTIEHSGELDLTEHIQNANAKSEGNDKAMRIVKRGDNLKIDLCVALSMGAHRMTKLVW